MGSAAATSGEARGPLAPEVPALSDAADVPTHTEPLGPPDESGAPTDFANQDVGEAAPSEHVTIPTVRLEDIEAARETIRGAALVTPMEGSRWLNALTGTSVHLKCENLQRTGSFKIRGAFTRISNLTDEERSHGVVAASAGNHAQGVALAAATLGTTATVFMPHGAPIPKENATRAYGADVRFVGHTIDEALVEARAFATETGAILIHPFDHPDIIAGQGTCGLEILDQVPDVATILVPTGGGGLIAGIATAVKARRPDVTVIGVQAENAAAYPESLRCGHPVALESMTTMADGIAVGRPGDVPFAAIQRSVDEIRMVSEESLSTAVLALIERAKVVVEPAGAAAVAAVLDSPHDFVGPLVVVLSGGNIDPLLMLRVIRHGMAAQGRYMTIRCRILDRPGGLAGLLAELSAADANLLDVVHERTSATLPLDQVEVVLQLETRGPEHREQVLKRLEQGGYTPRVN